MILVSEMNTMNTMNTNLFGKRSYIYTIIYQTTQKYNNKSFIYTQPSSAQVPAQKAAKSARDYGGP